jgi:hypothetical protein
MSLLRKARAELTGAVRSVRYDLGRRPVEPPAGGPDMTSTGMNTFGGLGIEEPAETPTARRPRRAALVTALGVLTVVGAAGAYLGVVNGLGPILNASQAEAGTVSPPPGTTFSPNSGIGRGPVEAKSPIRPADVTPAPIAAPAGPAGPAAAPGAALTATTGGAAGNASPIRTTNPTKPECRCGSVPPVPTPTAPRSEPAPSVSANPAESADPSPSETWATPSDSVTPSDSPQARHRRWHR